MELKAQRFGPAFNHSILVSFYWLQGNYLTSVALSPKGFIKKFENLFVMIVQSVYANFSSVKMDTKRGLSTNP